MSRRSLQNTVRFKKKSSGGAICVLDKQKKYLEELRDREELSVIRSRSESSVFEL